MAEEKSNSYKEKLKAYFQSFFHSANSKPYIAEVERSAILVELSEMPGLSRLSRLSEKEIFHTAFYEYLLDFYEITPADFDLFIKHIEIKTYKAGEKIISVGQEQRNLYFTKSGVQMAYFEKNKSTHVTAFTSFPTVCEVPHDFFFRSPSRHNLICLSDSEMLCLSPAGFRLIIGKSKNLEQLFKTIAQTMQNDEVKREMELYGLRVEERYKLFLDRSPRLFRTVPHHYLALYLGIDPLVFSELFNVLNPEILLGCSLSI